MQSENTRLSFKQNMLWNSMGNLVYLACQWLLSYVTTRCLGFGDAGILSLAMAISGSLANLALYAMRNYQTSDVDGAFSDSTYIVSRFLTSTVAFVACVGFVGLNGYGLATAACISVYMLFKVIEAISDVYQGIMQRAMRMDYIGKSFIAKGIVGFVAFTATMLLARQLLPSLVMLCVTTGLIVAIYDRPHAMSLSTSKGAPSMCKNVFSLLKVCLPLALYGLLFNTMGQAPRYFLESLQGTEALGFYSSVAMPVTIVQVSASFLFSPLTTPFAERLSAGDHKGFLALMKKTIILVGGLSLVALPLFYAAGPWLLVLLFGEAIEPYTYLIVPLVLSGILLAFSWFLSTLVTVLRRLNLLLVAGAVSFAIVVIGSIPMIELFGMNGTSFILIASMLVFIVMNALIIGSFFAKMARAKD